jgi:NAD(P)-dependent dehydrogenase (short-subunit alcohol dehydrogenase family)
MQSIEGHVAVVTGGADGIGLGIAKVLRSEGADVVLADIDGRGIVGGSVAARR